MNSAAQTVFFDGACPICRREIAFYQKRDGAEAIDWIDIAHETTDPVAPGLSRAEALGRFHVRTRAGEIISGAAAFAAVWRAFPALKWLGIIGAWPGIRHGLEVGYRILLKARAAGLWPSRDP